MLAIRAHEGQKRSDGSPYLLHILAVATILAEWGADAETIIAGLLHDTLEDTPLTLGEIKAVFGRHAAVLVEGVTKFTQADFEGEPSLDRKIETLRKLFEVMRRDTRVVIIKLADRLHNVRTIETLPPERRARFAKETMHIYYKLALHLGMNEVRREFSERCMPLLYPEEVREMRRIRQEALAKGKTLLREMEQALRAHDREGALVALEPHDRSFYSMWREREEEGRIKQGFVFTAIASDRDACYVLLRLLHSLYRPVSSEFHDFVAAPTESAYQTIRTAVLGPGNEFVPLRIRTAAMQKQERRGVLLWCFERGARIPGFSWLQRSEDLDRSTRESSEAFWEALQSDIFQETVSVIVDGKEIRLPRKATVLDALYARHGDDAHRTLGVRLHGSAAAFFEPLSEDAVLQVAFGERMQVSFEWLSAIETVYARQRIVEALKKRDRSEKLSLGQRLLQKELDHYRQGVLADISRTRLREVAAHFHREEFEEVLILIGEGAIQARDVVFTLYPEHRRVFPFFRGEKTPLQHFRLHMSGTQEKAQDILPKVSALARLSEVEIGKTDLRAHPRSRTFALSLSGTAPDRLHLGDFLSTLERQSWISHVRMLLSRRQRAFLVAFLSSGFGIILLDLFLLPRYPVWFASLPFVPSMLLQALPLLPILVVNYYLLRLLRHHVVRMRTDRWFLGLGSILNIIGFLAIIGTGVATGGITQGLLPLVALFLFSMVSLGYQFFQTEALFTGFPQSSLHPPSQEEWKKIQREKFIGYAIRLCAVGIWGIQPLYLKYTPANDANPLVRVFLMSIGILLITSLLVALRYGIHAVVRRGSMPKLRIPLNKELLTIIAGAALFTYFLNASLRLTTSTNFILFNNFSPILALLTAAVLWRRSIPYLKEPRHMLWIFIIFLMGSIGSSLIIYNSILLPGAGSLHGDVLGILAMVADTVYVIGQIRYVKVVPTAWSLSINLHVFSVLALLLLPVFLSVSSTGNGPTFFSLTSAPVLFSIGAGALSGIGQALNYEAFRRIDGFIAFLMFNISILITFFAEVFILGKLSPTWALLIGGITIISSSILAEFVSSRCQKRGM